MVVKSDKVRKLVTLSDELWAEIEDFRFANRVKTESDALRELLRRGLDAKGKGRRR